MGMVDNMNFNNLNEWHHTVVVPQRPNVIFCTHAQNLEDVRASGFLDNLPNLLNKDVLLTALAAAKKKPDWKFFITHNGGEHSTACSIVHEKELLGSLSLDSFYNSKTYAIDVRMALTSPSIRRGAQRKSHVSSSNPKRILRMLLSECKPTPLEQQAGVTAMHAATVARQLIEEATTYSVDSNINPTVLYAFLQERKLWDDYTQVALAAGAQPTFAQEVERRTLLKVVGDTLATAKTSGKMVVAAPTDSGYYVFGMDTKRGLFNAPPVHVLDGHLTDDMRTKLGMLKLASPQTLVPNVGVRLEDAYALIREA